LPYGATDKVTVEVEASLAAALTVEVSATEDSAAAEEPAAEEAATVEVEASVAY
jgi:hypothetical protein